MVFLGSTTRLSAEMAKDQVTMNGIIEGYSGGMPDLRQISV